MKLLNQLYLQQVIDETLRLGGIAIWLMREAKQDIEYQGVISFYFVNYISVSIRKIT